MPPMNDAISATPTTDQGYGIHTIDTGFKRPGMVAAHALLHEGRAALVDVGVAPAAPRVLHALDALGVPRAAVDYILVTHVHLDHAGAAGLLMQALPQARLVVHPRGAPHMIDPSKLIAGATAVYGEAQMRAEFGDIVPVPQQRVIVAEDDFTLDLAGRRLMFLDTPGHAKHHYCVYDPYSRGIFSGDTFGLSYREFDTDNGPWVFPTTTPVQFDPAAMHDSIDRLMDLGPEHMYLTHFGKVDHPGPLAGALHRHVDALAELALAHEDQAPDASRLDRLRAGVRHLVVRALRDHGCAMKDDRIQALMGADIELNAQGLDSWLQYRAKTKRRTG